MNMWKFAAHFTRFDTEKEHNFTFNGFFSISVRFVPQTTKIGI